MIYEAVQLKCNIFHLSKRLLFALHTSIKKIMPFMILIDSFIYVKKAVASLLQVLELF